MSGAELIIAFFSLAGAIGIVFVSTLIFGYSLKLIVSILGIFIGFKYKRKDDEK